MDQYHAYERELTGQMLGSTPTRRALAHLLIARLLARRRWA